MVLQSKGGGRVVCRSLVGGFFAMMAGVDALTQAVDDLAVGSLAPEQLPMVAAEALARGVDSPSLRALAGLGRSEVREARDLFSAAMTELGHPPASTEQALLRQARGVAIDFINRRTSEPEAADAIAGILYRLVDRGGQERWSELLRRFDLLAAQWQTAPNLRPDIEVSIRQAVYELLDDVDSGPRLGPLRSDTPARGASPPSNVNLLPKLSSV
jgi:hypothetical protein